MVRDKSYYRFSTHAYLCIYTCYFCTSLLLQSLSLGQWTTCDICKNGDTTSGKCVWNGVGIWMGSILEGIFSKDVTEYNNCLAIMWLSFYPNLTIHGIFYIENLHSVAMKHYNVFSLTEINKISFVLLQNFQNQNEKKLIKISNFKKNFILNQF